MNYIVYQITNLANGNYYIGAHQTTDINDNYMSSSKIVKAAIKKYGRDSFKKEVLYVFATSEEMFAKEAELVNEEFVKQKNTYNLKTGGTGSTSHLNTGDAAHRKRSKIASSKVRNRYSLVEEGKPYRFDTNEAARQSALAKANSEEAIAKKKETFKKIKHGQGENNSQFGRIWISNPLTKEIRRIKITDTIPEDWVRGKKGHLPKKLWVNNGIKEHYILTEKEQEYISKGFSKGRLKSSMSRNRIVV